MLKENLEKVEENIQAACDRAGRKRDEVTLIAVSKTKPVEMLQEAYDLGVRINGENKAQELASKYEVLPKDIHWHMIGHMQRNKVKYIIDKVDLIHSVDSVRHQPHKWHHHSSCCSMAAAMPDGSCEVVRGTMEGIIGHEIAGENGFGYDPIFFLPEYGCTSAELSPEKKNELSHRGEGLRKIRKILEHK